MSKRYTKEEIIAKSREIANMIANTEEVDFFKRAEAQINENKKISEKIALIKALQKQAVNMQHYGKSNAQNSVEAKIEQLEKELDDMPIVSQFKDSQGDVNDLLQLVSNTIANNVTNEIVASTGGDLLTGETGSKVRSSNNGYSTNL